jgi:acetoin:2,6-dichlorophenolindophenol oxidoreductase subunit beta
MKVAIPSTPYDAKGLLIQAIRDDDPVMFFEHKVLYTLEGDVPEESYALPFGEASIVRDGDDVTVVAIGRMVHMAERAADELEADGISCEIVDPRTTSPLDEETIYESVERTGRLVVVDESYPRCSLASDLVSLVAQNCFASLRAAPRMVTAPHAPPPFSPGLEDVYVPDAARVSAAVRETIGAAAPA